MTMPFGWGRDDDWWDDDWDGMGRGNPWRRRRRRRRFPPFGKFPFQKFNKFPWGKSPWGKWGKRW
ncbi:hypothetical protein [Symbiobacterium thermophilum]|uniref:Uncharacterized protein n=1 Tax=Symbiobacterium thermophilum TaxID=2734 RepID=A0A953I9E5_SYMTR|nr:hypothetical protein [Symbiobacterium thermophilum]MBY6276868.1 hypothetical protein [Symbiobacterium thermophilum]